MIKLTLCRKYLKPTYTIGILFIDDIYFCDAIEDTVRNLTQEAKVYGKTAIPTGIYRIVLSRSNKFKQILPEILNVPQFTGVRIHSGNFASDTEGCIIVGQNKIKGGVIESRVTLDSLIDRLLVDTKDLTITIQEVN